MLFKRKEKLVDKEFYNLEKSDSSAITFLFSCKDHCHSLASCALNTSSASVSD